MNTPPETASNGLSAYCGSATLKFVALALGGRFPDSMPDGSARQDIARRFDGRPAQAATATQIADPADDTDATEHKFTATLIAPAAAPATAGKAGETLTANWRLVKQSFAQATPDRVAAAEHFYARLFAASPAIRSLFPTSMTVQRERMFADLSRVIWSLDNEPECTDLLREIGREHRRYGVLEKHCDAFFAALRDTVEHGAGASWTEETAAAWQRALDYFATTLREAIGAAAETPAWWIAEIISHELRAPGVAVLRLRTDQPLSYEAGQYVPVQVARWSRTWRPYSVATAPRPGGPLELHVRAVPGGLVSNTLVHHSDVGDCVLVGAADGAMTLAESGLDLLCVAGGTGLAPIKAIIEQAIAADKTASKPRTITLFVGARQNFDLYDLEDLQLLEAAYPALRVIPVLSEQPGYQGLTGMLPDVVKEQGVRADTEAYICGPPGMVRHAAALLGASLPESRIHHDPLP
jgi:NAD(P)H-flavin reductase/hemoglobin-like flavoprotein